MRTHSILAISLLVLSCSGDEAPGGPEGTTSSGGSAGTGGNAGGAAGGGAGTGTSGGGGTAGSGTSGGGGTGAGTGGNGSGGATGGTGGTGGASGGGGSAGTGTGGTAGGTRDSGASSDGAGGTATGGGGGIDSGAGGSGGGSLSDANSEQPPGTCPIGNFPAVTDFSKVGPYMAAPAENIGTTCTVFRPTVLGENGLKHPVIIWGNGTGGNPGVYTWLLAHWATHGFIVVAAQTSSAGTGAEMVGCLDWIESQNSVAGVYQGKIALSRAGASGHSQGGGGTLMAGRDPRFLTTEPFMAYTQQGFGGFDNASVPQQKGPMFLLSGSADTIATPAANQQPVFMNTNVPVFWGTLTGADHVTFALGLTLGGGNPNVVGYLGPSTAWWRLHLMCDESARPIFYGTPSCSLCSDAQWTVQRKGIN